MTENPFRTPKLSLWAKWIVVVEKPIAYIVEDAQGKAIKKVLHMPLVLDEKSLVGLRN